MKQNNVDRVYTQLRGLAANFELKPDARINESALSVQLGTSRTPLREAMNRLVAEGFLTFHSGRGFFCRSLSPSSVMDLYEARVAVETEAVRLVCERATDADLNALIDALEDGVSNSKSADHAELLEKDEAFHLGLARLSQNAELVRMLENINERIRYVRLIYFKNRNHSLAVVPPVHRKILVALLARDTNAAAQAMRNHIGQRREDAVDAVRIAYSQLYVPDTGDFNEGRQ